MPRRKKSGVRLQFISIAKSISVIFNTFKARYISNSQKIKSQIKKRPLTSFFISLGILLAVIILSNFVFSPKAATTKVEIQPKEVQTYKIGSVPKLTFTALIEKSGVVKILAQTNAIVYSINVKEGQTVKTGTRLISLSSNYSGGNMAQIQASIAQKQYETISQTYDIQKDVIGRQRDLAGKVWDNTDKLRDISSKSLDDTRNLIDLNNQILTSLDQNLASLTANNTNNVNDATILATKQLKSQFLSAQNQIKSGLRNLEYSSDTNNTPQQLANIQKDITLKQLEMQEKSLELSRDMAKLQLSLANLGTSLYYPTAPFTGTIDKVYVKAAQQVNPGTLLFSLSGNKQTISAVVKVPEHIAKKISKQETSILFLNGEKLELMPALVSKDATDGDLYSVIYSIPDKYVSQMTDGSFIQIQIPVGFPDTGNAIPYVPLDAVFQTQEQAVIYIAEGDLARAKIVDLGDVSGRYVEVTGGLSDGDQIILNRNILEGDKIKVTQ